VAGFSETVAVRAGGEESAELLAGLGVVVGGARVADMSRLPG
jgi:hypothetical protein